MASWDEIRHKLDELRVGDRGREVFGASSHEYRLNERLPPDELDGIEQRFSVRFPDDYRAYLLEFSNGGAGPAYGVYKVGWWFDGLDDRVWDEGDHLCNPANSFRFTERWNLPSAYWSDELDAGASRRAEAAATDALGAVGFAPPPPTGRVVAGRNPFTGEALLMPEGPSIGSRYLEAALMDGAIPISYLGCNLSIWLVVSGPERGHVWRDLRADHEGVEPVSSDRRTRLTFAEWYESWLDTALIQVRG